MMCYLFKNSNIIITVIAREQIQEDEQLRIIKKFHVNPLGGQQCVNRTYQRMAQQYHWKRMRQMIKKYVISCTTCQLSKSTNRVTKEPMVVTATASRPFENILSTF